MNIEAKHPLLLVGCGKMGSAILSGLLPQIRSSACIKVVDPAGIPSQTCKDGISVFKEAKELPSNFEPSIIIFAVKPQQMEKVVPYYLRFVESGAFFISIAAGTTIKFFEGILGSNAPIVRAMPNTPALIQQAITIACPNSAITDSQLEAAKLLLETIGEVIFISDEDLLDPVTAISGSGPAYVFFMIECLTQAGLENGLPLTLASTLALKTVSGAGMLASESSETPEQLRQNVTSPGGTTFEALQVLTANKHGLKQLISSAVSAATRRSRELAD